MKTNGIPAALTLVTLLALATALPAPADIESPALAKYKKPVDDSVDKALRYLAGIQVPPGQSLAGSFKSRWPALAGNPGTSALCVMAFLSKGHTPGNGPYGETINRGVDFVLSTYNPANSLFMQRNQPRMTAMYIHCISTMLLTEISGMIDPERQKRIDAVLPKALNVIIAAQRLPKEAKHAGGWAYEPADATYSDISLSGWALMALRGARLNGAAIPKDSIDRAVQYILMCWDKADGGFRYQPGNYLGTGMARTGAGVLCLALCGQHEHPATIAGGEYMLRHMPRTVKTDLGIGFYYGEYYCSQAMFQLGGRYWEAWAPVMYDTLIREQQADGSWPEDTPRGSGLPTAAGTPYSTALAVLAMTVSCRQLPIYQR